MQMKAEDKVVSPSQFMRQIRPELYSDSTRKIKYQLKAEVLSHHLETITERNQTHDFELFCRKLCERTICPNLRPATGPEGGGDSKADTETSPVSDEISTLTFVGTANSGTERWAFAFSAKKTWADKARSDVNGIVATDRGYTKIFFVTSRAARAKDRARVEDELSRLYGVRVTIHDRAWIINEVIDKNRLDLAVNYLKIGDETDDLALGPSDYSRKQQLADIERELEDPSAFVGMKMQRASEALLAATLARGLELPRTDVDGRFLRAIRLADEGGTYRQQLTARYESLWTAFWWFDDIKAILDGYEGFETRVIDDENAINLEMLCNLLQLLFNMVIHRHRTPEEVRLEPRIARLSSRLAEMASDSSRPNNALEARTSLLTIQLNEAFIFGHPEQVSSLWPKFSDTLLEADGLGEFNAKRLVRLIEVFGEAAGKDGGYRKLVDQLSDFVAKRSGEVQGAVVLLNRAKQLDFDEKMEVIRLLGKAVRLLSKKENAGDLADAQLQLALAYQSAGLLWAARAGCTSAAATLFIEGEKDGEPPLIVFPALMNAAWQAAQLKHFPELLETIQIARGCLASLPFSDSAKKRAAEQLKDYDMVLACQLANLSRDQIPRLKSIPDVLAGLGLDVSRTTLLYLLGYEDVLRKEGWVPESETTEAVETFFNQLAGQPAGDASWRPPIFNGPDAQEYVTSVLGVQVHVRHEPTDVSITVAEAIVGTIEAFFATAFELEAFAHTERFQIEIIETEIASFEIAADLDRMSVTVRWPKNMFPWNPAVHSDFLSMLLEVAAIVFSATCTAKNFEDAVDQLFKADAAMERVAMIGSLCFSRERIFNGVARLELWEKHALKTFEATPSRPQVRRDPKAARAGVQPEKPLPTDAEPPKFADHRGVAVRSVIDVHLWDRARWTGVAYGALDLAAPPFMALMFRHRDAAVKIFERWRERFGTIDKNDEILIDIVRNFSSEHPSHYGMAITSNIQRDEEDQRTPMLTVRSITMEPASEVNLSRFLADYKKAGAYLLMPMVLLPGHPPQLIKEVYLLKKSLTVSEASDVGPNDLGYMFLYPRGFDRSPG
ncbi:hypothetical protein C5I_0130145 [Pseudomonas syringae pv. syringae FF5]|nr:hypothetical protein C5I_0130145 [Pseudomonas syringae pv. syringae FF5]